MTELSDRSEPPAGFPEGTFVCTIGEVDCAMALNGRGKLVLANGFNLSRRLGFQETAQADVYLGPMDET